VWYSDDIQIINPKTGVVRATVSCAQLKTQAGPGSEVLNGIAYDAAGAKIYLTGKLWSYLFEIVIDTRKVEDQRRKVNPR